LIKIPKLPDTLKRLICKQNYKLKEIPILPDSLQILYMEYCKMKHVPNIPNNILLITVNHPIVTVDENNLKEAGYAANNKEIYLYSPHEKILSTYHLDDNGELIVQWNAVRIISNWFIECKYNPKYKYCRERLQDEFDDLYEK